MADFRKMLFVLAGLLILISTAANAQVLTCVAQVANQPILRQEGATEPAGDIIITCTATSLPLSGAAAGPQTVTLFVSAPITSRQLFSGTTTPSIGAPTESTLLVNDNVTANPIAGASPPTQGFLQNGALVFSGFTLPNSGPTSFTVRITNVRVNANSLAAGAFVTGTVLATFGLQNQQNLVLGAVQQSLSTSVSAGSSFAQCTSTPTAGTLVNTLTIKELVNTAFKSPAVNLTGSNSNTIPGQWYQNNVNTESQTVLQNLASTTSATTQPSPGTFVNQIGSTPGLADSATRIRINFSNIPAGVSLSVPVTVGSGNSVMQLTSSGDLGAFSIANSAVTLTSPGSVTYQVVAQQAGAIDSFAVPVTITYTYTPPSSPNTGTILVSATYAPTTAEVTSLNPTFGIPRFADTSVLVSFISIAACQTDLLFTFMTNQAGFDTGFEIANTSTDPFGTSAQNGTCTLNWYGTGPAAGTATTTPPIASGNYYVNLVSSAAAGFQGYMIAVCNFQFGHGFAFITDGYGQPGRGLSQGYLANIIPTPGITPANACGNSTAGVRCARDASAAATSPSITGTLSGSTITLTPSGVQTGEALNQ